LAQCLIGLQAFKPLIIFNIVSSPTTISYLPTALGASKTTLLLDNVATSGPYAWQLPQCNITSNPYGGATGTYGLFNCIAIQNGAISAVVWFYLPPSGQGAILGFSSGDVAYTPWLYIGTDGRLYAGDNPCVGSVTQVTTPISPGWNMAVIEEWSASTTGPFYVALYLDGQYIGQATMNFPQLYGCNYTYPTSTIGTGNTSPYWPATPGGNFFFNGNIALVALYNRILTTGDVLAIWQGNLVTSGLVAVWYGDDYNPSNGYWVSRVGGYTGAPVTSSYPPRGCVLWNSSWYSGPTGIWSNWQQC
jgi:hypothetical protein